MKRHARRQSPRQPTSYDLVKNIRRRRLKWLGTILRGEGDRLLFQAAMHQYYEHEDGVKGTLFMDTPQCDSLDELVLLAREKSLWNPLLKDVPSHLREKLSIMNNPVGRYKHSTISRYLFIYVFIYVLIYLFKLNENI